MYIAREILKFTLVFEQTSYYLYTRGDPKKREFRHNFFIS